MTYKVSIKKNGKWKKHSEHLNYDYAEINAKVQRQAGFEVRIVEKDKTILQLKKEA